MTETTPNLLGQAITIDDERSGSTIAWFEAVWSGR